MLNVDRAAMMVRAITAIKQKPHDRVVRTILDHQLDILNDVAIQERLQMQQDKQKTPARFTLMCSTCRDFCAYGSDLRIVGQNQHVVLDKGFQGRVNIHRFRSPKKQYDDLKITGSIQCKKCHGSWGVMFIYKQMSFASLAIKNFIIMNQDDKEQMHIKSWKSFPYKISKVTNKELRQYSGAEGSDDSDSDEDGEP